MAGLNDKCVGRPVDWEGGIVRFCDAPVTVGRRFCNRCHLIAIGSAARRVEVLRQQLQFAESELQDLIKECV